MRRNRPRGIEARSRGYRRDDNVRVDGGVCRRTRKPRADCLARLAEARAFILREQNIPGGDLIDTGLAEPCGDRLSGLAEPDEAKSRLVALLGTHG